MVVVVVQVVVVVVVVVVILVVLVRALYTEGKVLAGDNVFRNTGEII